MDTRLSLPGWLVDNPELFRRLAGRVDHFKRSAYHFGYDTAEPRCVHGCNPFTDSCAGCDSEDPDER